MRSRPSRPHGLYSSAAVLRAAGAEVALHFVPGKGHSMVGPDRAEATALMVHFSKVLAAAPPGGWGEEGGVVELDPGTGPQPTGR